MSSAYPSGPLGARNVFVHFYGKAGRRTNASAETVNRATVIHLLAERQMGEFLRAMPKATGGANYQAPDAPKAPKNPKREEGVNTLAEIGISYMQSSRAQKLADIPAPEFHERIAVAKASGEKLSTAR